MYKFLFACSALALLPAPVLAQSDCTVISDDTERLACYDAENGLTAPETEVKGIGKWYRSVDVSALTDEKRVVLSLASDTDLPARFGNPGPAQILLRCSENTTSAFFLFNGHFMSDIQGYGKVEYRVDENAMRSVNTSVSTDNEALGLWRGSQSIPFIKRLIGGERLIIRATPYSESPMTATFDIRGLDDAIGELRETCNW